ncbi:SRPBCC family protein [Nocardioides caeni]|uniref:SRPBCC family protein n=1 Tax=Nocardioides caeni TaxID=574700 RepID=A0A4S8N1Z2_9ACTN|nr:SRPBCC family protein [Nocardioides caeni]THV09933.1 SRPBCC family protein [Nocardioides caeni]
MPVVEVVLPVPPAAAFAYLADPRNRPAWQSSLRAVAEVVVPDGDPTAVGVTWTDVTAVPGVRPRLRTVVSEPGRRWAEVGELAGFSATLDLAFGPEPRGTRVVATFTVAGWGVGALLGRLAVVAVRSDLRRAGELMRTAGHE